MPRDPGSAAWTSAKDIRQPALPACFAHFLHHQAVVPGAKCRNVGPRVGLEDFSLTC